MTVPPSLFSPSAGLRQVSERWYLARDGDPYALEIYRHHYSRRNYRRKRQPLFVGPGRKLVLLSVGGTALFAWRQFIDDTQPKQEGYNCAVFRNEGFLLSSTLIREAVQVVFEEWGPARCYTLVDPRKIRSTNPGYCFIQAGWCRCATSKTGKVILELPLGKGLLREAGGD